MDGFTFKKQAAGIWRLMMPWKLLEVLLMCEFQSEAVVETGSHISSHRRQASKNKNIVKEQM
jgi:hypothetical protein